MRRLRLAVPAPAGLSVELIGVPEGAPVQLDLRLESVMEGVLVSGTAVAPVAGECGRCLEPVDDAIEVELQELYAYPDSTTSETTEDDEAARLDGELLDLEPVLRDAVVLALPMTPLCGPDCPGLCAVCGERLAEDGEGHDHPLIDPRWAALARFGDNAGDDHDDRDADVVDHVGDESTGAPVHDEREN
ncbi:MAG: YceD family protein [Frankiaceae bacterium]